MTVGSVAKVKAECLRVISAIKDVEFRKEDPHSLFIGSKETGALRRASMDLTRALAEMRRHS